MAVIRNVSDERTCRDPLSYEYHEPLIDVTTADTGSFLRSQLIA